ncbi:hypothetical protein, partial [Devosia sp.]|uniref:hypothetical protein n=1 Tax=Devosia sp. TaxID=1871048 RepID=UPI002733F85A
LSPSVSLPLRFAFRQILAEMPLPSANTFANIFKILTGFTYRGLSPLKFTPTPGVHHAFQRTQKSAPLKAAIFQRQMDRYVSMS